MTRRKLLTRTGVAVLLLLAAGLAGGLWGRYGRPPEAPPPPEPTVEELLVGRWWYVEKAPTDFPNEGEWHYRADGTVRAEVHVNNNGHNFGTWQQNGIYRVEENKLYHKIHDPHNPFAGFNKHREFRDTIISIDRQRLVLFTDDLDRRTIVLERIE